MAKYFELTKPLYKNCKYIRASVEYKKGKGYIFTCDPCVLETGYEGKLYGTIFCKEYYELYDKCNGETLIIEAKRRSKKKQELAEKEMDKAKDYVWNYLLALGYNGDIGFKEVE